NVILSFLSTGTWLAPSGGSVDMTVGGPTVSKTKGSGVAEAAFPARSSKPASSRTVKCVLGVRRAEGVKIAAVLLPFHAKVPGTYGSRRNRLSTDGDWTGSLNSMATAVSVGPRCA